MHYLEHLILDNRHPQLELGAVIMPSLFRPNSASATADADTSLPQRKERPSGHFQKLDFHGTGAQSQTDLHAAVDPPPFRMA